MSTVQKIKLDNPVNVKHKGVFNVEINVDTVYTCKVTGELHPIDSFNFTAEYDKTIGSLIGKDIYSIEKLSDEIEGEYLQGFLFFDKELKHPVQGIGTVEELELQDGYGNVYVYGLR